MSLPGTLSWDFAASSTGGHLTGLHPYPARFIPEIPRQAIQRGLQTPGVVLDPFAGCGTTLVEAVRAGHTAIGVDVNHLAHLLQGAYTTELLPEDLRDLANLQGGLRVAHGFRSAPAVFRDYRHIPRLEHWFSEGAVQAIAQFLDCLEEVAASAAARRAAYVALSRVLVRISRQESDTQYRAVKPDIAADEARRAILSSLQQTVEVLRSVPRGIAMCRLGDARKKATFDGLPKADLVVTSPPYPNAYEYWLYHKYRMFWLDMDPLWSRTHEIGARPFYSGTGKLDEADFAADMAAVFLNLRSCTSGQAQQFWVVGDAIIKGKPVDTASIVLSAAADAGWAPAASYQRTVRRGRSSFQGIGRLGQEQVLHLVRA